MTKRDVAFMLMGCALLSACGATFPYKYYGLELPENRLSGPTASDDLNLSETCDPTPSDKSPCSAMLTSVAEAWKQDYLDTKNQLITCQHQLAEK